MTVYEVEDPQSGRVLELTGESPPTESELQSLFSQYSETSLKPESKVLPDYFKIKDQLSSKPGGNLTPITDLEGREDLGVTGKKEPTYLERLKEHADERTMEAIDIYDRHAKGEHGKAELGLSVTAMQMVGKVGVGGFFDFIGETMITGAKGLVSLLPDQIEDPLKKKLSEAGIAFLNTDVGKQGVIALQTSAAAYGEWADENRVSATNLESIVNISLALAPVKKGPGASEKALTKAGDVVTSSATKSVVKTKGKFIETLVTPRQTAAVKLAQVNRTTEKGFLRTGKVALTRMQKDSAAELKTVPLVVNRSIQKNYEIVAKTVRNEADDLVKKLKAVGDDGLVNKAALSREIDDALKLVLKDPAVVGAAENSAKKVAAMMQRELDNVGNHVSDILMARKSFDAKLISQGRKALVDPSVENAMTFSVRATRNAVNKNLDLAVKNVGVKKSLQRQHRLLNAMDDIGVKAAHEANNAIGRVFQKALYVVTLRNELNQFVGMALGIGGLGAAAVAAPWILGVGIATGIGYRAGRLVMSPKTRQGVSILLNATGKGVTMTKQMRADRALIKELLDNSELVPEKEVE